MSLDLPLQILDLSILRVRLIVKLAIESFDFAVHHVQFAALILILLSFLVVRVFDFLGLLFCGLQFSKVHADLTLNKKMNT